MLTRTKVTDDIADIANPTFRPDSKHVEDFGTDEKGCGDGSANGRLVSIGIKNDDIDGVDYIDADDVDDNNDIFDVNNIDMD
ncbi:unnamed protein product [Rotaria sordida]|uniref:Uncharacterized protein n=1 Tax=Rotaria sordida TaxID=392033 RepID=A0A815YAM6_9BILA|nr:unnamed protein product [Rotaria sordida]